MIPLLTDEQLAQVEHDAQYIRADKKCPVCRGKGTYRYKGRKRTCKQDDYGDIAFRTFKKYVLHNIPLEFQQLPWEEFPHEEVRLEVDKYIENFEHLRWQGIGRTFYSEKMGTGKTWAATQILKECVKKGYDGWFVSFLETKSYFEIENRKERDFKLKRLQEAEILVLDEVRRPWSNAQREFFASSLEDFLRLRMSANFPTIVTTNMTPEELEANYPRIYSLTMAKNKWIQMPGQDARMSGELVKLRDEMGMNKETWPIT